MKPAALMSLKRGMWEKWEAKVKSALPNFAANPVYVEQNSQSEEEFRAVAEVVRDLGPIDEKGKDRDAAFGGRLVETCLGKVTRMWLDSNIEIHFVMRHLPKLEKLRVLDIGAGYGRLAVSFSPMCDSYTCVDAVPISTAVCSEYCNRFAPNVEVIPIGTFSESYPSREFDLAVNVHSWNECTMEQVENWLAVLVEMKVPHLFTVSHGQLDAKIEKAYYTWDPGLPSFRPAIERYYDLVAEESIGLTNHPHALWKLKEGAIPVEYVPPARPLVWIATPMKHLEARSRIKQEDFVKLPPHYRDPIHAISVAGEQGNVPWRFELCLVGGGGVARARNRTVSDFLASTAEFLFFVDFDLMPEAKDYIQVLSRMTIHKLLVCGGGYTIRDKNGHWVYNFPDADGIKGGWALRVGELGTGFKCYHRSVFEQVASKNPWIHYENDDNHQHELGFFNMGPVKDKLWSKPDRPAEEEWKNSRWLTEDYFLDWLTRDCGIPIVWDTTIQLKHLEETTGEVFPEKFPPLPEKAPPGATLARLDNP